MENVDVICCCNNQDIFDNMLKKSIEKQKDVMCKCKVIDGGWTSAASAYNMAIDETNAEYIVFAHQDIFLNDEEFLAKCILYLKEHPHCVIGICGAKDCSGKVHIYSNIFHGLWKKNVGESIGDFTIVDGLDEVLLIAKREIFNSVRFDSTTFDGWHMYVADFCYQLKEKGYAVVVAPFASIHKSDRELPDYFWKYGILPKDYFIYMKRMRNKYRRKTERICTPCTSFYTDCFRFFATYLKMRVIMERRHRHRVLSIK